MINVFPLLLIAIFTVAGGLIGAHTTIGSHEGAAVGFLVMATAIVLIDIFQTPPRY